MQWVNNLQEDAKKHLFDAIFSVLVKDPAISPYLFSVLLFTIKFFSWPSSFALNHAA